jgi:MoaA/NifB/PqqE/SkfB family radical SAM enzyme
MEELTKSEEAEFLGRLKLKNPRLPFGSLFEITPRCNLNCIHCVHPINVRSLKSELKLKEIYDILDQLQKIGCIWLNLSGGEPFIRDDFIKIYKYAIKRGFLVSIFTNGVLINETHIKILKEFRPFVLRISLYGASEKIYYKITRTKNIFRKLMNNLLLLKKNGIDFRLLAQINKENINEAKEMKKIAKNLNAEFFFSSDFAPRSNGDCFLLFILS